MNVNKYPNGGGRQVVVCSSMTKSNGLDIPFYFSWDFSLKVFHVEDVIEATGYVLEKDSEYCQKFLEEEEEIMINITTKGGGTTKYQVK